MTDEVYKNYASSDKEAAQRAKEWRETDPFFEIPPALLSAEHIRAYVKQTGLIYPFEPDAKGRLKAASYEIFPGGEAVRWQNGEKKVVDLKWTKEIVLPANSITFMQTECKFRLPEYIALRFNLRIQHVHRGLLLGTGPLVDPNFGGEDGGELLIPVHNLTAMDYKISTQEGFIWVEFTKTSRRTQKTLRLNHVEPGTFVMPSGAPDRPMWHYFEKANKNAPIESSIPGEISSAKDSAKKSAASARAAKRTNQIFAGIGFIAVLGATVGLFGALQSANIRVDAFAKTASEAEHTAADLKKEIEEIKIYNKQSIDELRQELIRMRNYNNK